MPEQEFVTQALWYELPDELLREEFPLDVLQGSLHAAEHGQIAVLPLIAMCDRWDIGGLSTAFHHQTGRPTIFIYDGHPGGVGITRVGFERFERARRRRPAADLGVPLPRRLPLVRAVAQVRQPQRAAQQARRGRDAQPDGRALGRSPPQADISPRRSPAAPADARGGCTPAASSPPSSWRSPWQQQWGRLPRRRPAREGERWRGRLRRARAATAAERASARRSPSASGGAPRRRRRRPPATASRSPAASAGAAPTRASAPGAGAIATRARTWPPPPARRWSRPTAGIVEAVQYQARGAGHYVVHPQRGLRLRVHAPAGRLDASCARASACAPASGSRRRQHGRVDRPAPALRDLGGRLVRRRRPDRPAAAAPGVGGVSPASG